MRSISAYALIALLLACPVVCRATVVACCQGEEVPDGCADESRPEAPAPPAQAAGCLCSGTAVKADDPQAAQAPLFPPSLLHDRLADVPGPVPGGSAQARRTDGPRGPAGPVRLHALLGPFRC